MTDHAALLQLWAQSASHHATLQPKLFSALRRERPAGFLRALLDDRMRQLLVAETVSPSQVVGLVELTLHRTGAAGVEVPALRGYVDELVVAGSWHRRGVASVLMKEAQTWCRDSGATQLMLTVWSGNRGARALYDSLGYRELGRVLGIDLVG